MVALAGIHSRGGDPVRIVFLPLGTRSLVTGVDRGRLSFLARLADTSGAHRGISPRFNAFGLAIVGLGSCKVADGTVALLVDSIGRRRCVAGDLRKRRDAGPPARPIDRSERRYSRRFALAAVRVRGGPTR